MDIQNTIKNLLNEYSLTQIIDELLSNKSLTKNEKEHIIKRYYNDNEILKLLDDDSIINYIPNINEHLDNIIDLLDEDAKFESLELSDLDLLDKIEDKSNILDYIVDDMEEYHDDLFDKLMFQFINYIMEDSEIPKQIYDNIIERIKNYSRDDFKRFLCDLVEKNYHENKETIFKLISNKS